MRIVIYIVLWTWGIFGLLLFLFNQYGLKKLEWQNVWKAVAWPWLLFDAAILRPFLNRIKYKR